MGKIAKALVAGVVAGIAAGMTEYGVDGDTVTGVIKGIVAALGLGGITWGVPNAKQSDPS